MALGFFRPSGDPNVDMDTRRKIALAMLAQNKRAYPKTFGEGLASIGDSISDAYVMRQLLEQNAEENKAGDKALEKYTGGPQAAVEPTQQTTYAPPESMSPAVAAINSAAPQGPPIVPVPPPRARTIMPPTAPSGGAAPVAAGPGGMVEPGEFNEVDAADPRNRYRAPPAYLAPALERNIADPERRGYLGQLAGKEAQSAGEVSSTGAAGPFQFTRGTGAQYGIPGNARFDPDASTRAVNAFTDDNVRALTAKLGREPTPGEMALAHQQGAGTAGNMLTGAGNASPSNLAVNNVPAGAGPQAAASKIMGYYGMPGATGVPASPREAVTAAVAEQQRPAVADYGQRLALAATPQQAIPAAPSAAPVRAAPQPQQVAQANSLVPPLPAELANLTPPPTMTPVQQSILRDIQNTPPANREAVQKRLQPIFEQEQAKITQMQEIYKEKLAVKRAIETEQYKLTAGAPKTAAEIERINQEIADARKPKVQKLEGDEYERNPQTGVYEPVRTTANPDQAPPLPKNEFQLKSLKAYEQMQDADRKVGEAKALRSAPSATGSQMPVVGGYLQSDAYRNERAAAERWVINKVRVESGADIKDKELDREVKAYFPQPSDDAKTVADKNAARKIANEGMKEASGREGKNYLEWRDKQAAKEVAEAVEWLKDHKDDPRAAAVRKRLGL